MCTHSLSGEEATRIVLKKLDSKAYAPDDVSQNEIPVPVEIAWRSQ